MGYVAVPGILAHTKVGFITCLAIGLVLSGLALASASNSDHVPPDRPVELSSNNTTRNAAPCLDVVRHLEHCCSIFHCMTGIPLAMAALPDPPPKPEAFGEQADVVVVRVPGRLDRPPK